MQESESQAFFRRDVLHGGCALTSEGFVSSQYDDDLSAGGSKITFEGKAKFKDNLCDVSAPYCLFDCSPVLVGRLRTTTTTYCTSFHRLAQPVFYLLCIRFV